MAYVEGAGRAKGCDIKILELSDKRVYKLSHNSFYRIWKCDKIGK